MSEQGNTAVVVLGGGYAGTVTANRLQQRADVDITLVNPRPYLVERIRLHQLVAGTHRAAIDYATLLGPRVRLVVDSATRIDTAARSVRLASGGSLPYDYVVYAVGSTAAITAGVPGAAEFAYPIGEWEPAQRLRDALDQVSWDAPIVVVGGGLTGIETAAELGEQGRAVTLLGGGRLAPTFQEPARRSVAARLSKLGVRVRPAATVTEVGPDRVVLADGTVLPAAVTIWTAGFGVPDLAARSGPRTDDLGRLCTDETLTSVDDDRVVGAGDASAPSGAALRMSCQAAEPLGAHAADTVSARIAGTAPTPLDLGFVGSAVSLGRRAAAIQFARRDDTAVGLTLGGRLAALGKEAVCRGTVIAIRREGRKPGSLPTLRRSGTRAAAAEPRGEATP